jgi:DNA repair ATPase RecN
MSSNNKNKDAPKAHPQAFATFWKCALQVNSWSYSKQYQGADHKLTEDEYNKAIVDRCLNRDIRVVGLADHGSVDGVSKLRAALEAEGLTVFPGFEIASTEKVHMVCLYPSGTDIATLNQHLGGLELPKGAKTAPSSLGCLEIAKRVEKHGGFWYAAHATGASGILRLNQDGGGLHHIWCDCSLVLAAQIPGDVASLPAGETQNIVANKNPQYKRDRAIALLNAKDVRKPEDLDNDRCFSWIKMTSPSLEALRLACRDPESRVRLSHEINPAYYSRIEKIVVRRGYLEDLEIELSPNLNAVVGGRGTGKSTLIEAIRFALQLPISSKDAERAHQSVINENFAKEKAGIEITVTSFQQNSERYVISRYYGNPAKVLDENGTVLKLSPKDILPRAEVYGQNELLAIVNDASAKAQLLGRFLPDDATDVGELAEINKALSKNRQEIDDLEEKVTEIDSRLEQLPPALDREKSFKKLGLDAQLEKVKLREQLRAYAEEAVAAVDAFESAVADLSEQIADIEVPEIPSDIPTGESTKLKPIASAVAAAQKAAENAAAQATKGIDAARTNLDTAKTAMDDAIAAAEQSFHTETNKLPAMKGKSVSQLVADYKKVSVEIAKLKPLNQQKAGHGAKLISLRSTRATLLERLAKARGKRWSALSKAVKALNKRLEGQLRVEFEPERIREPLKAFLLSCDLEGIGEKRLAWIDEADSLSVPDLVALIAQGSEALQERYKAAGISRQAADAIATLPAPSVRELEELELPERLELLLNVVRDGEQFREVARLSTGQQCTAILHLLLLDNPDPLIIDQPEDNLDNAFIADHIVGELRNSKTKRQFLFATHNANIPVFGDAEWIGVLQEHEGKSRLQASGSIDADDVKTLAANILEGGREAFARRREKYGL